MLTHVKPSAIKPIGRLCDQAKHVERDIGPRNPTHEFARELAFDQSGHENNQQPRQSKCRDDAQQVTAAWPR